jgi:hypothetical protein
VDAWSGWNDTGANGHALSGGLFPMMARASLNTVQTARLIHST